MKLGPLRKLQFALCRYAEPRALFEWQSFFVLRKLLNKLPKGDGHPVLVFPGFGSSDRATRPLRGLLDDLNYQTCGWGLGSNILFDEQLEAEMVAMVRELYAENQCKVSLIGWSLGGVFAREVAKVCPEAVRCVITLGSPISGKMSQHTSVSTLFRALNGEPTRIEQSRYASMNQPPPVPTTSIYSRTDGIVAWEGSVQKDHENTENIEIPASHLGLGVNPLAMIAIADRLAQEEGKWQPFKPSGLKHFIFKRPAQHLSSQIPAMEEG